jgi:hypothetical protein
MDAMTVPDVWSGQDRMITVEDMQNMPDDEFRYELDDGGFGIPAYWIVEPDRDRPELTVFELRSGAYEQAAHVLGSEEYRAVAPFPVTIVPSQLVTAS